MCADGRKQQNISKESDATSPTVSTGSVLITTTIDASENRYITIVDVSSAFLAADMVE